MSKLKNIHPGEILLEEFLIPMEISQNKLARSMNVPPRRINEIVLQKRSITADTDLRLSRALGTSEGFWLGLQSDFDLEEKKKEIISQLPKINTLVVKYETRLNSNKTHTHSPRIAEPVSVYTITANKKKLTKK